MLRSVEQEIKLLANHLQGILDHGMTDREISIARSSYLLGRCTKEIEITKNRKLFEGKDEDEE